MKFELRRKIGADHPSLPGHFPGTPIVPGVVILDEVVAASNEWRGESRVIAMSVVKFLAPLKPEQSFTICLTANENGVEEINFVCRIEDQVIVEGRLEVSSRAR